MKGFLLSCCTAALLVSSPVLAASSDHSVTNANPNVAALDDSVDPGLLKMNVDQLDGKDIYGSDGKNIAEIEDIVRYNNQLFAVIDVDETLDTSDKDVVLPLNKLRMNGDRLTVNMTNDQLKSLEAWQKDRYEVVKHKGPLSELGR